jgi:hypothetical protein
VGDKHILSQGSSEIPSDASSSGPDLAPAAAVITSITAGPGSGDLGPGNRVTLTVNFNDAVTVSGGTPTLVLNDGGEAIYQSGSGSNALTFAYTVGAFGSDENTSDLALAASNAFTLNGASITDAAGNSADLSTAS